MCDMTPKLLALFGVTLSITLIFGLLVRKDADRRANRLLAAALVCSAAYMLASGLVREDLADAFPRVTTLLAYAYFAGPPLLFGYTRELASPGSRRWAVFSHLLIPAGLIMLAASGLFEPLLFTEANLSQARGGWPPSPLSVMSVLLYVVTIAYVILALIVIRSHQATVNDLFSYTENVTLNWLRLLLVVYLLLSLVGLLLSLVRLAPETDLWQRSYYSTGMLVALSYLIAFIGISQPAVFSDTQRTASAGPVPDPAPEYSPVAAAGPGESATAAPRYQTSSLTVDVIEDYWQRITSLMLEQKLHLNSDLRVADLAELADIPSHQLSQTINQRAGKNFFHFINDFRVETAQELLREGNFSLSAITFESGFNSQSAFYRHFKKVTGMTPREYQRRINAGGESGVVTSHP